MKTLLAALLVAGALLLGTTSSPVGAAGLGPRPAGLVAHLKGASTHAPPRLLRASTPTCNGSSCTGYESAINRYFADVGAAAASHATNNVYSVATQYCQGTTNLATSCSGGSTPIAYGSSFGGSVVDTSAYPASGCDDTYTPPVGQTVSDPICLTDAQLQAEIQKEITANSWPTGTTKLFFIFTPSTVGICSQSGGITNSNNQECSTNSFCAYHSYIASGSGVVYAVQPYDVTIPGGGCDQGEYPNHNDADATINTVSHEQNEAITDPTTLDGWYSAEVGNPEIGDLCAWTFGTTSGTSPAEYTQTINGDHYWLQEEYSNAKILNGGCVQSLSGPANPPDPKLAGADGVGPLVYNGGPVMTSNTVYAIYWVPSTAPTNSSLPVASGTAAVGKILSTSNGGWSNSPTSYSYQWQQCSASGTGCANISGATGSTYKLAAGDAGHTIRSEVSAHNAGGSSSYIASAPTAVVVGAPKASAKPSISGKAKVGKRLAASSGSWSGSPSSFRYQWLRCSTKGTSCARISGATKATYKLAKRDLKHRLRVRVTAVNAAGKASATSATTRVVKK